MNVAGGLIYLKENLAKTLGMAMQKNYRGFRNHG
jgi:hypothetical protein